MTCSQFLFLIRSVLPAAEEAEKAMSEDAGRYWKGRAETAVETVAETTAELKREPEVKGAFAAENPLHDDGKSNGRGAGQ